MLEILIPWRSPGCPYRQRNFEFVFDYYSQIGSVVIVDSTHKEFNRSNARNIAVDTATSEVFLLVDADCIVPQEQIIQSINLAIERMTIVHPYNKIHFLNDEASIRYISSPSDFKPQLHEYVFKTPNEIILENSGGAYVVIKSQWKTIGGMNESFIGWGGEDSEFNRRYVTRFGNMGRVDGDLYSLYHPATRDISRNNINLFLESHKIL